MSLNPEVTFLHNAHRYNYRDVGIEVLVERFSEGRDGLHAEMLVTTSRPPRPGVLKHGRLNLVSAQAKSQFTRALRERATDGFLDDADFVALVEQVCLMSTRRWRDGNPAVDLREVSQRPGSRWLLEPYIEFGGPTIMFADGGSGKSLLAMAMAVSVASGISVIGDPIGTPSSVLYLDWEADEFLTSGPPTWAMSPMA